LRVAGVGSRLGAWLIDGLILGVFQFGFWMLAVSVGVLGINPGAERQLEAAPLALPTVAPYQANLPALAVMLSVFVLLNVVYAAVCWARFRALPGQRALSLQVGSAVSGRNLSLGRAFVRAVVALGIPVGAVAGIFYAVFAFETQVPWSDVLNPQTGVVRSADARGSRGSGLACAASDTDRLEPDATGPARPIGRVARGWQGCQRPGRGRTAAPGVDARCDAARRFARRHCRR
jgi:hypothetical protein